MKEILTYLYSGSTLSKSEAEKALVMIGQNNCSEIEITSFLTVYLMREITPEELAGFRAALVSLSVKVDLSDFDTIDVCGTGGDGKNTFNISTISSFVLAGAGIRVAKHGNYGVSSPVGSSNLLEHFGYRFSNEQEKLYREIEATGFTFMHAPLFHPAMKYVAPVRKGLKTKTFFNMLGPMINPASPKYQLTGVYSTKVQSLYDQVYRMTGNQYLILHGLEGYDEISLTGPVKIMTNTSEEVLSPADLGFQPIDPSSLYGGETAAEAASIFMDVLMNRSTPEQKNVVLANVASGIRCVHPDKSWSECVETGRESLESGKALQSFKKLMEVQKEK